MTSTSQLFSLMRSTPFRPYRLKTAGGLDVAIIHPEAIAYGGERTVLVALPGDRWEVLDINLIESIEGTNQPQAGGGPRGGLTMARRSATFIQNNKD
jgi:hypothetical protein